MPSILQALGIKKKAPFPPGSLPRENTFVDASLPKARDGRVAIERVLDDSIVISHGGICSLRMPVTITYENPSGRYRFESEVVEVNEKRAILRFPQRITTLAVFSTPLDRGREAPRVDMTLPTSWRLATAGRIVGETGRGVVTDLSRNGASIAIEPSDFIPKMQLELKISVGGARPAILVLTEIVRVLGATFGSKTRYGIRFVDLAPADEETINQLINRRQTERRTRGLI